MRELIGLLVLAQVTCAIGGDLFVELTPEGCSAIRPPSSVKKEFAKDGLSSGCLFYVQEREPCFRLRIVFSEKERVLPKWIEENDWKNTFTTAGFYKQDDDKWKEVEKDEYKVEFAKDFTFQDAATKRFIFESNVLLKRKDGKSLPPGYYMLSRPEFTDAHLKCSAQHGNYVFAVSEFSKEDGNDTVNLYSTRAYEVSTEGIQKDNPELLKEALSNIERALSVMPENDDMLLLGADVACHQKDYDKAITFYTQANEL